MKPKVSIMVCIFSVVMAVTFFTLQDGYGSKPRVVRIIVIMGIISSVAALASGAVFVKGMINDRKSEKSSEGVRDRKF